MEQCLRVLVTGAAGFVGINLVRDLANADHEVVAVDTAPLDGLATAYLGDAGIRVTGVVADLRDDPLSKAFGSQAPDVVIHAAAITPLGDAEAAHAVLAAEVNVAATARLMRWVTASGVRRVIHVSTGSVYGPVDGDNAVDEDVPHRPDGIYGITKSAGERVARRLAALGEVTLVVVRLSHVYGPMERPTRARVIVSPIERWTRALIAGDAIDMPASDEWRDFVHVSDVARAVAVLVERDGIRSAVYNVSSGHRHSEVELVEHLRTIEPTLRTSRAVGRRATNPRRPPLSIRRIERDIGWRPRIDLADGLRSYLDWRRASGG